MTTPQQRHRVYVVGPRPARHRMDWTMKLAIGLCAATVGLIGLEMYETHSGTPTPVEGVVTDHGMRLVGKVVLPTTTIQITDGPFRWRLAKDTDSVDLPVGTPVSAVVREGQVSGELHADEIRALPPKPKTP